MTSVIFSLRATMLMNLNLNHNNIKRLLGFLANVQTPVQVK